MNISSLPGNPRRAESNIGVDVGAGREGEGEGEGTFDVHFISLSPACGRIDKPTQLGAATC